jgi:hypothetical protein
MPKKRTQKKTSTPKKGVAKKTFDPQKIWQPAEKFFLALYEFLKTFGKGLLVLIEKILRFVVDIILATAKVIQAVGIAFFAIAASAFLVVLAGYLFAKAVDLPGSKNFQAFREETWEILITAAEPDFEAWRSDAQAWIDYRSDLKKLYDSKISHETKLQKLVELKDTLNREMDEGDPNSLEMRIMRGI